MERDPKKPAQPDPAIPTFVLARPSSSAAPPPGGIGVSFPGQHGQHSGLSTSHIVPSSQVFSSGCGAFHAPRIPHKHSQSGPSDPGLPPTSSRSVISDSSESTIIDNTPTLSSSLSSSSITNEDSANKFLISGPTPIHSGMYSNLLFNSGFNVNLSKATDLVNTSQGMDSKLTHNIRHISGFQDAMISPNAMHTTIRPPITHLNIGSDSTRTGNNEMYSQEFTVKEVIQRQREHGAQVRIDPVIHTPKPTYNRPIIQLTQTVPNTMQQTATLEPNVLTFLMHQQQLHGSVSSEQTIQQLNWISMQKKQADERQQREEEQRRQTIHLQLQREEEQRQKTLREQEQEIRLFAAQATQLTHQSQIEYQINPKVHTSLTSGINTQIGIEPDLIRRAPPYVAHSSRGRPSLRGRGGAHNVGSGRGRGMTTEPHHSTTYHIRTQAAYQAEARARAEARAKQLSTHRDPREILMNNEITEKELPGLDFKATDIRSRSLEPSRIQMKDLTPQQQLVLEQHHAIASSNLPIAERQSLQNALSMVSLFQNQQPVYQSPQSSHSQTSTPTHSHSRPNILRRSRMDNPITPLAKRNLLEAEAAKKAATGDSSASSSAAHDSLESTTIGSGITNPDDTPRKRSRKQVFEPEPEEDVRMSVNVPLTGLKIPPQGIYINGQHIQPEKKKRGRPRNDGSQEYTITRPITVTTQMKINLNSPVESSFDDSLHTSFIDIPQRSMDGIPFYTAAEVLRQQRSRIEKKLVEHKKRQAEEEEAFRALPVELQESIRAQKKKIMEQDAKKKEKKPRKPYTPRGLKSHIARQTLVQQHQKNLHQQNQPQQQQQAQHHLNSQFLFHSQTTSSPTNSYLTNPSFDIGWTAQSGPLVPANMLAEAKTTSSLQPSTVNLQVPFLSETTNISETITNDKISHKPREPIITLAARKAPPEQSSNATHEKITPLCSIDNETLLSQNRAVLKSPHFRMEMSSTSPEVRGIQSRVESTLMTPTSNNKSEIQVNQNDFSVSPTKLQRSDDILEQRSKETYYGRHQMEDGPSPLDMEEENHLENEDDDQYENAERNHKVIRSQLLVNIQEDLRVQSPVIIEHRKEDLLEKAMNEKCPNKWQLADLHHLDNEIKELYNSGCLEHAGNIYNNTIINENSNTNFYEILQNSMKIAQGQTNVKPSLNIYTTLKAKKKQNTGSKNFISNRRRSGSFKKSKDIKVLIKQKRTAKYYYRTFASIWGEQIHELNDILKKKHNKGITKEMSGEESKSKEYCSRIKEADKQNVDKEKAIAYRNIKAILYTAKHHRQKSGHKNGNHTVKKNEIPDLSSVAADQRQKEIREAEMKRKLDPAVILKDFHKQSKCMAGLVKKIPSKKAVSNITNTSTMQPDKESGESQSKDSNEQRYIKESDKIYNRQQILSRASIDNKLKLAEKGLLNSREKMYSLCLDEYIQDCKTGGWKVTVRKSQKEDTEFLQNEAMQLNSALPTRRKRVLVNGPKTLDNKHVETLTKVQNNKVEILNIARDIRRAKTFLKRMQNDNGRSLITGNQLQMRRNGRKRINVKYMMQSEKTFVMINQQKRLLKNLRKRLIRRARIGYQVKKFATEAATCVIRRFDKLEIDPTPCEDTIKDIQDFLIEIIIQRILKSSYFIDKIVNIMCTDGSWKIYGTTLLTRKRGKQRSAIIERKAAKAMNVLIRRICKTEESVEDNDQCMDNQDDGSQFSKKIDISVSNRKRKTTEKFGVSQTKSHVWHTMVNQMADKRIRLNRQKIIEGYSTLVEKCRNEENEVVEGNNHNSQLQCTTKHDFSRTTSQSSYREKMQGIVTIATGHDTIVPENLNKKGESEYQTYNIGPEPRKVEIRDEKSNLLDVVENGFVHLRKCVPTDRIDDQCLIFQNNKLYEKVNINGSIHYVKLQKTILQSSIDERKEEMQIQDVRRVLKSGFEKRKIVTDYVKTKKEPLIRKRKLELLNDGEFAGKLLTNPFINDKLFYNFFTMVYDEEITILEEEEIITKATKILEKNLSGLHLSNKDRLTLHDCLSSITTDMIQRHKWEMLRLEMKLKKKLPPRCFEEVCRRQRYKVWDRVLDRYIYLPKLNVRVGYVEFKKTYESIRSTLIENAKLYNKASNKRKAYKMEAPKQQNLSLLRLAPCKLEEIVVQPFPLCLSRSGIKKWYLENLIYRENEMRNFLRKIAINKRLNTVDNKNCEFTEHIQNRIRKLKKEDSISLALERSLHSTVLNLQPDSLSKEKLNTILKKTSLKFEHLKIRNLRKKFKSSEKRIPSEKKRQTIMHQRILQISINWNKKLKYFISSLNSDIDQCKEAMKLIFKDRQDCATEIFDTAEEVRFETEKNYKSDVKNKEKTQTSATGLRKNTKCQKTRKLLRHFEKRLSGFVEKTSDIEYQYLKELHQRVEIDNSRKESAEDADGKTILRMLKKIRCNTMKNNVGKLTDQRARPISKAKQCANLSSQKLYMHPKLVAYIDRLDEKIANYFLLEIKCYYLMEKILHVFDPKTYLRFSQDIKMSYDPNKSVFENQDAKLNVLRKWIRNPNVTAPTPIPALEHFSSVINNPSMEVVNKTLRAKSPFWNGPPCMENEYGMGISRNGQLIQATPMKRDDSNQSKIHMFHIEYEKHLYFADLNKPSWEREITDEIYEFVREFDPQIWGSMYGENSESLPRMSPYDIITKQYFINNEPELRNRRDIHFKNQGGVLCEIQKGFDIEKVSVGNIHQRTYEAIQNLGEMPREILANVYLNNHRSLMAALKIKLGLSILMKRNGIFGKTSRPAVNDNEDTIVPSLSTRFIPRNKKDCISKGKDHRITPSMYAEYEKKKFFATDHSSECQDDVMLDRISEKQILHVSTVDIIEESIIPSKSTSISSSKCMKSPSQLSNLKSPSYITSPVKSPSPLKSTLNSPVSSPMNKQIKQTFNINMQGRKKELTSTVKVRKLLSDNEEDQVCDSNDDNLSDSSLSDHSKCKTEVSKATKKISKTFKRKDDTEEVGRSEKRNYTRGNKNLRRHKSEEKQHDVEIKTEPFEPEYEIAKKESDSTPKTKRNMVTQKKSTLMPTNRKKKDEAVFEKSTKEMREVKQEIMDDSYEAPSKRIAKPHNTEERPVSPDFKHRTPAQSRRSHPTSDMRYDRVLEYVLQKSLEEAQQARKQMKK